MKIFDNGIGKGQDDNYIIYIDVLSFFIRNQYVRQDVLMAIYTISSVTYHCYYHIHAEAYAFGYTEDAREGIPILEGRED